MAGSVLDRMKQIDSWRDSLLKCLWRLSGATVGS